MRFILALDEGTSGARAALYDTEGRRAAIESIPIECAYPALGWVEQDPLTVFEAQIEAARRVLQSQMVSADLIAAIGITNQRETAIVWDRVTGQPVAPAIVWQCRRTAPACAELRSSPHAARVRALTGLEIDPYFSATKIRWILDHVRDAQAKAEAGDLLFGTVDAWLVWRLSSGRTHITDTTNASRTMLMNLETGEWDEELLSHFEIPRRMLPKIVPSCGTFAVAGAEFFGCELPISGIAGDQQAALAGQACFSPGQCKNTYGTGCFALMHTGDRAPRSRNGLLATRAASFSDRAQFALEGSVFVAGAAIQWLRDQLKLIKTAAESEQLAAAVPDTGGVYFVPAFTGLGAPHWDASARGIIAGLTRSSGPAHIVRAALESIAYQSRELIEAMESDAGSPIRELRVDGGAASNDFLMQFQSDILGRSIIRPKETETTALGAAYLAGLAAGFWESTGELESFWRIERTFEPRMSASKRDELFAGWKDAVLRCRR